MEFFQEFMEQLLRIPSITGFEEKAARFIEEQIKPYVDWVKTDTLGNVIAFKKGSGKKKAKLMFETHYDQIGLMITKIEENGILRFTNIGGINKKSLPGKRVKILAKDEIYGIIGTKPPHLMSEDEAKKIESLDKLYIDCGFGKQEIEKLVKVGDIAIFDFEPIRLSGFSYSSAGLDDKAGAVVVYSVAKMLSNVNPYHDLYFCFSVQEEVGLRGAKTAAYGIDPDFSISLDVTFGDPVGNPLKVSLGKGPTISFGPGHNPSFVRKIKSIADREDIPFQFEIEPRPAGTDAAVIQITKKGVYTALLGIPLRYMHSQVEIINTKDLYRSARICANIAMEEELLRSEEEIGNVK